jgi:hypothetical protein
METNTEPKSGQPEPSPTLRTQLRHLFYYLVLRVVADPEKLFMSSLFKDAFLITQIIQRGMKGWEVNDALGRMWKEAAVA